MRLLVISLGDGDLEPVRAWWLENPNRQVAPDLIPVTHNLDMVGLGRCQLWGGLSSRSLKLIGQPAELNW